MLDGDKENTTPGVDETAGQDAPAGAEGTDTGADAGGADTGAEAE